MDHNDSNNFLCIAIEKIIIMIFFKLNQLVERKYILKYKDREKSAVVYLNSSYYDKKYIEKIIMKTVVKNKFMYTLQLNF